MGVRFTVASDPEVDRFLIRDCDGRLNRRDKDAVDEWIKSGKKFHAMRDHPQHVFVLMGGLWGGTRDAVPSMVSMLHEKVWSAEGRYNDDQLWLKERLWPLVKESVLIHDAFSCLKTNPRGIGFPSLREYPSQQVGSRHMGPGAKEDQHDANLLFVASGRQPAACRDRSDPPVPSVALVAPKQRCGSSEWIGKMWSPEVCGLRCLQRANESTNDFHHAFIVYAGDGACACVDANLECTGSTTGLKAAVASLYRIEAGR